jgi:hypothetical protein
MPNASCCHRKAPVRRETKYEAHRRRKDQIPNFYMNKFLRRREEAGTLSAAVNCTVNEGLVPSKAKFVKDTCIR